MQEFSPHWRNPFSLGCKRFLDLFFSASLLAMLSPLFLILALAVKLNSMGPVFYRWKVVGKAGRPFTGYKFRSMRLDADLLKTQLEPLNEMSGPVFKLQKDPRITRVGAWLRRASLDELPQLWNIARGDLSFIGPRALLERYLPYYTEEEHRRHTVRPGLSGWAQIHGRNYLPFDRRLRMDVWYVDHLSLRLDLRIFLATIWLVLSKKDVSIGSFPFQPLDVQRSASRSANMATRQGASDATYPAN